MSGVDVIWTMFNKIQKEREFSFEIRKHSLLQNICLNRIYAIYHWAILKKYDKYEEYTPDFARVMFNCRIMHPKRICDVFENLRKYPLSIEDIFNEYFKTPYDYQIDTRKNIYIVTPSDDPNIKKDEFFNPINLQEFYLENKINQNVFILPIANDIAHLVHIGANNSRNSVMHDLMLRTTYIFNSTRDQDINDTIKLISRLSSMDTSFEELKTKFVYVRPDLYENLYRKHQSGELKHLNMKTFHVHRQDLLI